MDQNELMHKLVLILEDSKAAVLATTDAAGRARVRWMTPGILNGRPGCLYALTSRDFHKVAELDSNPTVEWMFQDRALTQVINVRGRVSVVDNPSLKSELMEAIGSRIVVLWKHDVELDQCVVLETVIEEAVYYQPMKGVKVAVSFA